MAQRSIVKSSGLFAAGTVLSRISGLVRDQVFLAVFGASALQDAFTVAYRIPNLLRDMLAEGALSTSFTKVLSSIEHTEKERADRLFIEFFRLCVLAMTVLCGIGIFFSPELVQLMTMNGDRIGTGAMANSSNPEFIKNTIGLTRVLFPFLGLAVLSSVVMGALHSGGRFFLSASSTLGFNLGNIIGATVFAYALKNYGPSWIADYIAEPAITGAAVGVVLGGMLQLCIQLQGVKGRLHARGLFSLSLPWNEDVKKVLVLMIPAAIAASTGPINGTINLNFATALPEGSATWITYAFRLMQLPIGIFAVAVGSAVLPALARSISDKHAPASQETSKNLQHSAELILWVLAPCMVFLICNDVSIVDVLFQRGKFMRADSIATGQALAAYSYGILGYGLIKVFTSFYYAVERVSYAMGVAFFTIIVNLVSNTLLVHRYGHVGLAMTTSISLSINAFLLFMGLRQHRIQWNTLELSKSLFTLVLVCIGAAVLQTAVVDIVQNMHQDTSQWFLNASKFEFLITILINAAVVSLVFAIGAMIRLNKDPKQLLEAAKRFRRRR